jgi:SAM-dependent methyltransferase
MENLEKKYYENSAFWENGMLEDPLNMERIEITSKLIPQDVKSLADIGCGNGVFLNFIAQKFPEMDLIGVDRSEFALNLVKTKKLNGDIGNIPLEDHQYDCVSCLEVIEHLPIGVYENALNELCRISKKYIIISVPFEEKIEDSYTKCPCCLTIFNWELHLRRFEKNDIIRLLEKNKFKCISHSTLGLNERFVGHELFKKIFYPKQMQKWNSPICPVCGYSEQSKIGLEIDSINIKPKRSILSYFTSIPKLFWPKTKRHYWILALYERE